MSDATEPTRVATDTPTVRAAPADLPKIGRYAVKGELGRGGFGVVLRAHDPVLDRDVAIKVLHAGLEAEHDVHERFFREARAAAKLGHPNIVPVFEVGFQDARPFLVMELVRGEGLERAATREPLGARRGAEIVRDIARAVEAAHKEGILHRDLKPGNVVLGEDGRPRLTDFGLARDVRGGSLTEKGEVLGTPAYMAPEQLGEEAARGTVATDIYSLGAILYRLIAGRPPFGGVTPVNLFRAVLLDAPTPPRRFRTDVPPALEAIALRCLEKDPAKRYRTAGALAQALEELLVAPPPSPEPSPAPAATATRPTGARPAGPAPKPALSPVEGPRRGPSSDPDPGRAAALVGVAVLAILAAAAFAARDPGDGGGEPRPPSAAAQAAAAPASAGLDLVHDPAAGEIEVRVIPIIIPADGGPSRARAGTGADPTVRAGDGIRFEVTPSAAAHVYIFNVDGSGRMFCLFPKAYGDFYRDLVARGQIVRPLLENPIAAGRALIPTPLPGPLVREAWFQFDETKGLERYYLFASAEPIADLEALIAPKTIEVRPGAIRDIAATIGASDLRDGVMRVASTIRGSHKIVVGDAPAEVRLEELPERRLEAIASRLRGRTVIWEFTLRHE